MCRVLQQIFYYFSCLISYYMVVFFLVNTSSAIKSSSPSTSSTSSRRTSGPFQIKLGNPPIGRRVVNGTSTSNSSSPTSSSNNDTSKNFDIPPPIPPRSSLLNTTNKRVEGQFVPLGEIPVKAPRKIFRSRNVKRREPITTNTNATAKTTSSKQIRSDSADALSAPSSGNHSRNSTRRQQVTVEQGTNSD